MKSQDEQSFASFREKLENEYNWPSLYTFKFIVPVDKKSELLALFSNHEVSEKQSSKGNYISITSKVMSASSDVIIEFYVKASQIKGVIAL